MNRLFWGLLFCLLDYELTVGTAVFEILPDFVGFFLLMKGMEELAGENSAFDKGRHWAFGMVIVSVILWIADLMDLSGMDAVGFWALGLAGAIVELVVLRKIVTGVGLLERENQWELGGGNLKSMWTILAVMLPLCHLLDWVPLIGTVCGAARWITGICFLGAFWGTRKRFYGYVE